MKTNKEDENKLSVETLKGSSRPRLLSQMGARCRASDGIVLPQVLVLGAKLKNKGGWGAKGDVKPVSLSSFFPCASVFVFPDGGNSDLPRL